MLAYFSLPVLLLTTDDLFEDQDEQKRLLIENYPIYKPVALVQTSLVFYLPVFHQFAKFLMVTATVYGTYLWLQVGFTWSSMRQVRALLKYAADDMDPGMKLIAKGMKVRLAVFMMTLVKPAIFVAFIIFLHIWNANELVNSAWVLISMHGLIHTIGLCYVESNYRRAILTFIARLCRRPRRGPKPPLDGVRYQTNEEPVSLGTSQVTILEA
ncbi:unnamed protein product, partial [Mesorhabditis spiculigera]